VSTTAFGAEVVTIKPLVLSYTSLTERPLPWTRRILPDHIG
jgi:hypothetical protein